MTYPQDFLFYIPRLHCRVCKDEAADFYIFEDINSRADEPLVPFCRRCHCILAVSQQNIDDTAHLPKRAAIIRFKGVIGPIQISTNSQRAIK